MIDGVKITPLLQIHDERGSVMHMLKATDPVFNEFGEIYFLASIQMWLKLGTFILE